ncbi:hypothetical protein N0V90_013439 [Kalmusia sp. IMI 367209]|nr:hypothetical protein N0V90_013439 [Kalmusia sp. IMI 367209]
MPPTTLHAHTTTPLTRRYSSSYCTDYLYMRECNPHRIIIGVIIGLVLFFGAVIIALLCVRHRKRKTLKARTQQQVLQKAIAQTEYEQGMEREHGVAIRAPPPAYAKVDPRGGVGGV